MKIGVIVAMDKELAQLQSLLEQPATEQHGRLTFHLGRLGAHEIVLQKCGIGKVNSALGAMELISRYAPDVLVSSGCAGGARSHMQTGDIVVGTETVYHDAYCGDEQAYGQVMGMPATFKSDEELVGKALALDYGTPLHHGLIAGGDWFVNTREKMGYILDRFPQAVAVDMESCSIAQTCYLYATPFISFRIVSDVPLNDTKASQYFDFWDRMAEGSFHVTKQFLLAL